MFAIMLLVTAVVGIFCIGFIGWAFVQPCINKEMQDAKLLSAEAIIGGMAMVLIAALI